MARPALPSECEQEILSYIEEVLPGVDKVLVEELAADYMLEAVVCVDPWEFGYILDGSEPLFTQTIRTSARDLPVSVEQLLRDVLSERNRPTPPSGVLMLVRACPALRMDEFQEAMQRIYGSLHSTTRWVYTFFRDPTAQDVKVRIFLAGDADPKGMPRPGIKVVSELSSSSDVPAFLKKEP